MSRRLRWTSGMAVAALALVAPLSGSALAGGNGGGGTDALRAAVATLQVDEETVEVKAKGTERFVKAEDGDELRVGDTVRTGSSGRAEIQYDDESYTRLDVDTTFKLVSLSDEQGNRKVEGSLDSGRTWNRAEGLTESESFAQTGAGATAAVQGTAFAVDCHSLDDCDFVGVVHETSLTGTDGQKALLTLDLCKSLSGVLCAELTKLGPGALFDWIQGNLLRDLLERGLGPGPFPGFTGTISVSNGILTVTETPPPDLSNVLADDPILCNFTCDTTQVLSFALPEDGVAGGAITVLDDGDEGDGNDDIEFAANLTVSPEGFFVVFTSVPHQLPGDIENPDIAQLLICDGLTPCSFVQPGVPYVASTLFTLDGDDAGSTSFTFHIVDGAGNRRSRDATVPVEVVCTFCDESAPQAAPPTVGSGGGDGRNAGSERGESPTTAPPTTETTETTG